MAVSFESPEYTADVDAMGTLRLLEAIRILGLEKKTRFFPSIYFRVVWFGARDAAKRDHTFLSTQPLCGGQDVRLLDYGELP